MRSTLTSSARAARPAFSPNRFAALMLAGVLLVWATAVAGVLLAARLPPERAGLVVALFPPGSGDAEVLFAVARAEGELVRPTWLGSLWLVNGAEEGFVGRLKAEGALAAFAPAPFNPMTLGGCGFIMPPEPIGRRPGAA